MAIASMQKIMIVAHRSQTVELLQSLQKTGMVQILDAERAMVTKEWPELMVQSSGFPQTLCAERPNIPFCSVGPGGHIDIRHGRLRAGFDDLPG